MKDKYYFDKGFFLLFSGFLISFSISILFVYIFLTAYFHPSKKAMIAIDYYGEANLELFMFFILIDFFIICLVYSIKRIFNKENKNATQ